jgi:methionyl-tRNA synthetase
MAKFYITNAIPYVNASPHVGHALEFVQSDTITRYHKILGDETLLLCGGDENALKNVQAAEQAGVPVQEFVDTNTKKFYDLSKKLNVQFDVWQKGSDISTHFPSSQKLWELCSKNGDIYKKSYTGLYCIGCEVFYTREELDENGECFEHPGKKLEEVSEENYFFKLSKYQKQLIALLETDTLKIFPEFRKNEMLSFIKQGLSDISISRSNERAKNWGVPVPDDDNQRMYVWFDALNIYQSGIGFDWNEKMYKKWWPADLHVIGKGIIRFHAIYWPAILMSAGLQLPKAIFVHEYFTVDGRKMSKTLGNVIDPEVLIDKYGADSLRYYFLAKFSPFSDGDFSEEKFKDVYNADLANGLGNLVARVAKLCENSDYSQMGSKNNHNSHLQPDHEYSLALSEYKFNEALAYIWKKITKADQFINEEKPWSLLTSDPERSKSALAHCVDQIQEIAELLSPFLPETAAKIAEQFKGPKIVSQPSLFPRL